MPCLHEACEKKRNNEGPEMLFVDTDVMVDVLRQYPPAMEWLKSLGDEQILLSGFVYAELIQGCANKDGQKKLTDILSKYSTVWPEFETCQRALSSFADFHLSHGLGLIDALIGQIAVDMQVPFYTFNVKHYKCIPGLTIKQPYEK